MEDLHPVRAEVRLKGLSLWFHLRLGYGGVKRNSWGGWSGVPLAGSQSRSLRKIDPANEPRVALLAGAGAVRDILAWWRGYIWRCG
jgi:hypothetical protein